MGGHERSGWPQRRLARYAAALVVRAIKRLLRAIRIRGARHGRRARCDRSTLPWRSKRTRIRRCNLRKGWGCPHDRYRCNPENSHHDRLLRWDVTATRRQRWECLRRRFVRKRTKFRSASTQVDDRRAGSVVNQEGRARLSCRAGLFILSGVSTFDGYVVSGRIGR
jgi:hypothetical protein